MGAAVALLVALIVRSGNLVCRAAFLSLPVRSASSR